MVQFATVFFGLPIKDNDNSQYILILVTKFRFKTSFIAFDVKASF